MENKKVAIKQIESTLITMNDKFKSSLPSNIGVDKFRRIALAAIYNNHKILDGNRETLYIACQMAAQDGLILDGREAALVMFGSNVQYMPMVSGLIKKARNTGQISSISADVVHENDSFEYWIDEEGPHMMHRPLLKGARGEAYLAYSTAKLKDGSVQIEVMTKEQIEKVKSVSRSKNGGPWKEWPDEMWKKTVLRRLLKYLPSSAELEQVLVSDNEIYDIRKNDYQASSVANDNAYEQQPTTGKTRAAKAIIDSESETVSEIDSSAGLNVNGDVI